MNPNRKALAALYRSTPMLVAALLAGCGPSDDRVKLPTTPVQGTLYIDDKPFGPAKLTLAPVPADGTRPVVSGVVTADGKYTLSTYSAADEEPDGAPPGEYQVGFSLDAMNPGNPMPILKRGADTITIPDETDASEPVQYDMKVTSTGREATVLQGGKLPTGSNAPGRPRGMMPGPPTGR